MQSFKTCFFGVLNRNSYKCIFNKIKHKNNSLVHPVYFNEAVSKSGPKCWMIWGATWGSEFNEAPALPSVLAVLSCSSRRGRLTRSVVISPAFMAISRHSTAWRRGTIWAWTRVRLWFRINARMHRSPTDRRAVAPPPTAMAPPHTVRELRPLPILTPPLTVRQPCLLQTMVLPLITREPCLIQTLAPPTRSSSASQAWTTAWF